MKLLLSWAVLTAAFLLAAAVLPGMKLKSAGGAIGVAAVFGVLNFFLGWLMFAVIGFATLGIGFVFAFLTRWLVDVVLLKMTAAMSEALELKSSGTAIAAALLIAGVGSVGQFFVDKMF